MYIKVRVDAGGKKETFQQLALDTFRVTVKEPAERNLANKRVRELIAKHYEISIGSVRLISGHHSPSKIFSVDNSL